MCRASWPPELKFFIQLGLFGRNPKQGFSWKWQVVDAIHTEHGAESVSVVSCFKTVVEMRLGARLDDSETQK